MKRDKNYHPNNFFDNFDNLKTLPFRDALIVHLKKYDQDRNVKAIIYEWYKQASKGNHSLTPVVVCKMNTREPLVIIGFNDFFELIKY